MITLKGISKVYDTGTIQVQALVDVDLTIAAGDFAAIMGPSGSGKSTLMNILGLLDQPSAGAYILDGTNTGNMAEEQYASLRNKKIGFVFQNFNLLPRLTAVRNVELPLLYSGVEAWQRRERAEEALERVGLLSHINHRPNELSGGQKQRVAIARALVNNPAMLLADEPTGNLDSEASYEIMALFQGLHKEGSTIVLVTHEPEIAEHSQRIIHFRDGRLVSKEDVERPLDAREMLAQWRERKEVRL